AAGGDKLQVGTAGRPDADVARWPSWAVAHGINPRWYDALGKGNRPTRWFVVERPIPWPEWTKSSPTARSDGPRWGARAVFHDRRRSGVQADATRPRRQRRPGLLRRRTPGHRCMGEAHGTTLR